MLSLLPCRTSKSVKNRFEHHQYNRVAAIFPNKKWKNDKHTSKD